MNDEEASAIMLAENTGCNDLDPVDEALAYQNRIEKFKWEIASVAQKAGVSIERVKRRLKLLNVKVDILQLVRTGIFLV
jgi:ParB-like chromosome segregation protein Spo0J